MQWVRIRIPLIIYWITFFIKLSDQQDFLLYFQRTWCEGDGRICKILRSLILNYFYIEIYLLFTTLTFHEISSPVTHTERWAKVFRIFPHANQDTNTIIESYHCMLKTQYIHKHQKKCTHKMNHLYFTLVYRMEPFYRIKQKLQEFSFIRNYKVHSLQKSIDKSQAILDDDCIANETRLGYYFVKSQTTRNYYVDGPFNDQLYMCDFPWALQGNTCKHALKVLAMITGKYTCSPNLFFHVI